MSKAERPKRPPRPKGAGKLLRPHIMHPEQEVFEQSETALGKIAQINSQLHAYLSSPEYAKHHTQFLEWRQAYETEKDPGRKQALLAKRPKESAGKGQLTPSQAFEQRKQALGYESSVVNAFESRLRAEWVEQHTQKGKKPPQPPKDKNFALDFLHQYQARVRRAQALRNKIWETNSVSEKKALGLLLAPIVQEIYSQLAYGHEFEVTYRAYTKQRNNAAEFISIQNLIADLLNQMEEATFTYDTTGLSKTRVWPIDQAYIENESRQPTPKGKPLSEQAIREAASAVWEAGTPEYIELVETLKQAPFATDLPKTKYELQEELKALEARAAELWEMPGVSEYVANERQMKKYVEAIQRGDPVVETPSVVEFLNSLWGLERSHPQLLKAILVGPPGVGKTTILRYYLKLRDIAYDEIDFSEEVSRFTLFGARDITDGNQASYYKGIIDHLAGMQEEELPAFIAQNAQRFIDTYKLPINAKSSEATIIAIQHIMEAVHLDAQDKLAPWIARGDPDIPERIQAATRQVRDALRKALQQRYNKVLGAEIDRIIEHKEGAPGWRDGVILAAIRNKRWLLINEFTRGQLSSATYGILEKTPGSTWSHPETNEIFEVPDIGIMMTANIGRRYGSTIVQEALASRASGKVINVGYPPAREEFDVAQAHLSTPWGEFLRYQGDPPQKSNEFMRDDQTKLWYLISEVFPTLRKLSEENRQMVPISYRTIVSLAEKLVNKHDARRRKVHIYQPTQVSFDRAVYEVLVGTNEVYEDKTARIKTVQKLTDAGLLLDDESIKNDVIKYLSYSETGKFDDKLELGASEYARKKAAHEKNRTTKTADAQAKIKGVAVTMHAMAAPRI